MNNLKAVFNLCVLAIWSVFGTFMALGVPPNDKVIVLMAITLAANAFIGLLEHIFKEKK